MITRKLWLALSFIVALYGPAQAQSGASGQIRIVVPTSPGSGYDFVGRQMAEKLRVELGVATVVDNRVGAVGQIGAQAVIAAPADGNTLLVAGLGDLVLTPALKTLPYDPAIEFRPVVLVASFSFVLLARNELPEATLKDLVAFASSNPGKRSIANPGLGSGQQVAAALLKRASKADFLDVQYRSAPAVYTDLLGGLVDMTFDNVAVSRSHIEAGRLKAFMVTASTRHPLLPQVPTATELGLPDATMESWSGLFARASVPQATIDRLRDTSIKTLQDPALQSSLQAGGWRVLGLGGAQADEFLKQERAKWPGLLKEAGVRAE